ILAHYGVSALWLGLATFLLGVLLSIIRAGELQRPIFQILNVTSSYIWDWLGGGDPGQIIIVQEAWAELVEPVGNIFYTFLQWMRDAINGAPRYQLLVSKFLWGWTIWLLSVGLSWSMRRYFRPLWGFLPIGILMAVLLSYIPGKNIYLLVFVLGSGFTLLGLAYFERNRMGWSEAGIPYYSRVERTAKVHILFVSIMITIIAVSIPSVSIEALTEPIQEWSREQAGDGDLMRALGVKYQPEERTGGIKKVAKLPRSHLIGSAGELEERVVMVVDFPQGTTGSSPLPREARYWRSYAYNQYSGLGWSTTPVLEREYNAGQVMSEEYPQSSSKIVQEFQLSQELVGPLYTSGLPLSVNREYKTFWRKTSQNPEAFDEEFLIYKDVFAVAVYEDYYQVESAIPVVDEEVLKNSSGRYSGWIRERYLDMRRRAPLRVEEFASQLVEGETTNYDKAKKIEEFLRQYEYTLDLPPPPEDGDIVEYFLFDLQKGYCDYYATAMVVMARAVGIPARLAVGYVDGMYDPEGERYLITEADAHSWPELYFNDVGWVPFEPTAQREVFERDQELLPIPFELDRSEREFGPGGIFLSIFGRVLFLSAIVVLILISLWVFWLDPWQLRRGNTRETLTKLFHRFYRWGYRLNIDLKRPATPYQFAHAMRLRLLEVDAMMKVRGGLAQAGLKIERLADLFVKTYYGPEIPPEEKQVEIIQTWKRLRWRLMTAYIFLKLHQLAQRFRENIPFMNKSPVE
ncbi:MAG: hypothetical protein KGY39_05240, partial [Anaerolineales bacterium]|nr:hypothetical protein [Anaerolineales bacterium]